MCSSDLWWRPCPSSNTNCVAPSLFVAVVTAETKSAETVLRGFNGGDDKDDALKLPLWKSVVVVVMVLLLVVGVGDVAVERTDAPEEAPAFFRLNDCRRNAFCRKPLLPLVLLLF